MTNVKNKKINQIEFPKPTLVSVNGVELEVFEAGKQNKVTQLYCVMDFLNLHFLGAFKFQL